LISTYNGKRRVTETTSANGYMRIIMNYWLKRIEHTEATLHSDGHHPIDKKNTRLGAP